MLKEGVYENLISNQLAEDIAQSEAAGLVCKKSDMDVAEASEVLSRFLSQAICKKLDDADMSPQKKVTMINRLLAGAQVKKDDCVNAPQLLSAVLSQQQNRIAGGLERPRSGFRVSNLFTGGQSEISLADEILRDIASADRICIIVSFLRMSGIRMILDNLKEFCGKEGHSLRIITTTYCGITEAKAVEQLSKLPNTEIRISYNTNIERLHAKAYIFERNSGFSTAYIGSSNLSHSAQTDGLEWNIRVTNVENPHIIKSAVATFERYWDSDGFEDFRLGGIDKFNKELNRQRTGPVIDTSVLQHYQILPHQKAILDRLQVEREEGGLYRNLVVAATGTGKTVIAAFDYKTMHNQNPNARLLFVAHREEILKQSLYTFRSVLQDANFGELWVGTHTPSDSRLGCLFMSVQTFGRNVELFESLGSDYYDYIVIDEAHHAAADSYRKIVDFFKPKILLGLTATPERMDGRSLLPDFGNKISAEIRLAQALDEGLLTPFQYICISDSTDLSSDELWSGGKYVVSKLSDKLCNTERVGLIVNKLQQYLPDEHNCHALCFCTDKRHAAYMADKFKDLGLRAAALTSDTDDGDRASLNRDLAAGKINYLCVVDIFNEGVDIPEVDTVLFLRPTDSLTVFLQQLGRGMRLCANKQYLTVLDFVAQLHRQYDFASRLRSISKKPWNPKTQTAPLLPAGCSIYMERVAKKYILDSINKAIYNNKRLVRELASYGSVPTLSEFLAANGQDVRLIYKGGRCWTSLKKEAGKCSYKEDDMTKLLTKSIGNLAHVNSPAYIRYIREWLDNDCVATHASGAEEHYALMLYYALFMNPVGRMGFADIYQALSQVGGYPLFKQEIGELMDYLMDNLEFKTVSQSDFPAGMELYGCYTRDEIFVLFDRQTAESSMSCMAGVFNLKEKNTELFFVTLNKSDKDFSPTTQYDDYFISANRFHWQSQNSASHNGTGARYVNQSVNGRRFILFVREAKEDAFGNTMPYYCLGPVNYIRSYGNKPMNIEWKLSSPALAKFIKAV